MEEPLKALQQSYLRTKAKNYKAFRETMELHTNSSNNTIYADANGEHRVLPLRTSFRSATRSSTGPSRSTAAIPRPNGKACMSIDETPNLLNPASGWLYNTNNWPWSAAGPNSPKRADYPAYVDRGTEESPRGFHALRVLDKKKDFTLDR